VRRLADADTLPVASMDKRNDKLARYSSHGDKVVEMAAVGEDVLSTVPGGGWEEMSGTSMATPISILGFVGFGESQWTSGTFTGTPVPLGEPLHSSHPHRLVPAGTRASDPA
jgi:subtilisin family serine protease